MYNATPCMHVTLRFPILSYDRIILSTHCAFGEYECGYVCPLVYNIILCIANTCEKNCMCLSSFDIYITLVKLPCGTSYFFLFQNLT